MKVFVTGAYGYSGQYIARRLLEEGHDVFTLTNSPNRASVLGDRIIAYPLDFQYPDRMAGVMGGADALVNTYWVRFNHPLFRISDAVQNVLSLFRAAGMAGVRKIVHISITNPDIHSSIEYFAGKARLEAELVQSGMSFTILRPAVIFGREDILMNNIAWALRRFPLFLIFGDGNYRLQPIYVEDLAELVAQNVSDERHGIINAIGPETYTFNELVSTIKKELELRCAIFHVTPEVGYPATKVISWWKRDVLITPDEIKGLMANLLYTGSPAAGFTSFRDWVRENRNWLGMRYANEVGRRTNRTAPYA